MVAGRPPSDDVRADARSTQQCATLTRSLRARATPKHAGAPCLARQPTLARTDGGTAATNAGCSPAGTTGHARPEMSPTSSLGSAQHNTQAGAKQFAPAPVRITGHRGGWGNDTKGATTAPTECGRHARHRSDDANTRTRCLQPMLILDGFTHHMLDPQSNSSLGASGTHRPGRLLPDETGPAQIRLRKALFTNHVWRRFRALQQLTVCSIAAAQPGAQRQVSLGPGAVDPRPLLTACAPRREVGSAHARIGRRRLGQPVTIATRRPQLGNLNFATTAELEDRRRSCAASRVTRNSGWFATSALRAALPAPRPLSSKGSLCQPARSMGS